MAVCGHGLQKAGWVMMNDEGCERGLHRRGVRGGEGSREVTERTEEVSVASMEARARELSNSLALMRATEEALREETRVLELLNQVGITIQINHIPKPSLGHICSSNAYAKKNHSLVNELTQFETQPFLS